MSAENILISDGNTRDRIYRLKSIGWTKSYPIVTGLTGDLAWADAANHREIIEQHPRTK
jgi:hypothetical protein